MTTPRREAYWLAVIYRFAFGMAAGDLLAAQPAHGHAAAGILFSVAILGLSIAHARLGIGGM